ncbi:uncharacterized protein BROUX77_000890 [Berkeleyomyces rouxiae]|uniref:uncharacterized protein n=1 Tax=Berkeleyomyces rouxiae TaxID=2035830 RepID=UPI003B829F0A
MNPGVASLTLPELSQVEEMLIARVQIFMEVRRVRDQQYRYSGHAVNFLQNVVKVYDQLPLFPRDPDTIILKPSNFMSDSRLATQFVRDFRVRQGAVRQRLCYLKRNHRGCTDVTVDENILSQLPEDGNITNGIAMQKELAVQVGPEENSTVEPAPDLSVVPNLVDEVD